MPNRSLTISVVVLLAVLGIACAKGPFNLDILRRDGYGVVPLSLVQQNELTTVVTINGQKVRLILDTGFGGGIGLDSHMSAASVVTESKALTGEGFSGKKIEAHRGSAQTVAMGNVQLTNVPVQVGAFGMLSQANAEKFTSALSFEGNVANVRGGEGFIGRDFLRTNHAVIDLPNKQVYLRPPGKGRAAQLEEALTKVGMGAASMTDGNIVDVEVNGVPAKMIVDTGAVVSMIDSRFAAKAKVSGWGLQGAEVRDISGVSSRADLTHIASLKIGGVPVRDPTVSIVTFNAYAATGGRVVGLLGLDFLGLNWSIIDFGGNKLYFARAK